MNRIKELRTEAGWTQTDLAERISAVKSTISRYESEAAKLDPATIEKLCRIFGCTSDYLLGLSNRRSEDLTPEEAELLAAYRLADDHTKEIVEVTLRPFLEKKESAAG